MNSDNSSQNTTITTSVEKRIDLADGAIQVIAASIDPTTGYYLNGAS